jgi:hypothetical protein
MTQLEQFFKRSNFNDLKPFSCSSCGAGYGSAKTLKKHMSDKHGIKVASKKGRKPKDQSEEADSENQEEQIEPEQPIEQPQETIEQPQETIEHIRTFYITFWSLRTFTF